ncbi:hypothetical protein LCX93_11420 [Sulfurimonas sp. SWIR-19]|uniref:hypothetical protein n=1 Tax=Sulfurimonas sp. SWIR-19 TaxID=2878390 RepID=UPI001CF1E885|nr:hypothetical protein [Sulfurimonas sp. SWIR-19]UCN00120.1 hypothetical protein LCX93_11420 [Sulfurimonas sp. SWIR-19]
MAIHDITVNETQSNFTTAVGGLIDHNKLYPVFGFGNVRRLTINNKYIYLWQDAKGQVCYCFDILDKEYFSASPTKLGNVLSNHFQQEIEVVNNIKERLKKITNSTIGLNKALSDSQRHADYLAYSQSYESQNTFVDKIETFGNSAIQTQGYQPVAQQHPQNPMLNQEQLHKNIIELSAYQHQANMQTLFISINELPIVHKNKFMPNIKQAFFIEDNATCKNTYRPSQWMTTFPTQYDINNSFILQFIFFMVKRDIKQAIKILLWLANCFTITANIPFPLVLHSDTDTYMKLFYEDIVEPLLNADYCQVLSNDDMNEKSLSKLLDKKVIYRFHNVTQSNILNTTAKDFSNRLIHKDNWKLNNRVITTVTNCIITSTTSYIPLISKDVPSLVINVDSSLDDIAAELNISSSYYEIAKYIEYDMENFTNILKKIDFSSFYTLDTYNGNNDTILDGDTDILKVFEESIKNKDSVLFQTLETKEPKLYNRLINDFHKNRVNRKYLLKYFTALFETEIYKSNRAIISDLKELSSTSEPFENTITFNNNGDVYYRL